MKSSVLPDLPSAFSSLTRIFFSAELYLGFAGIKQYRQSIEKIVDRLKKTEATLIWCATTPVPKLEAGRKEGDEIKYNSIAKTIMEANGIATNDLHAHALLKSPTIHAKKGDVHFTKKGYAYLAAKVAKELSKALKIEYVGPIEDKTTEKTNGAENKQAGSHKRN